MSHQFALKLEFTSDAEAGKTVLRLWNRFKKDHNNLAKQIVKPLYMLFTDISKVSFVNILYTIDA